MTQTGRPMQRVPLSLGRGVRSEGVPCGTVSILLAACLGLIAGPSSASDLASFNLPKETNASFPDRLSETGLFTDSASLSPHPALVPYELNVPFWSDGAAKRRWIALPEGETIGFESQDEWRFPAGTVFVKHFELPSKGAIAIPSKRLETRVLIRDASGATFGASYRWRDDATDADLVRSPVSESKRLRSGTGHTTQRWYFPGPEDCRKCHLPAFGGVLGVSTRQLNRGVAADDFTFENQLGRWHRLGLLPGFVPSDASKLPKLAAADDPNRSIEDRARSFIDANCAYCHRPGGAVADFDARWRTPLPEQNLLGVPARIDLGIDGAKFVVPRDPWRSMLLVRTGMLGSTGMPPLAHETVDEQALRLLQTWIESLPGPPTLAPPTIESESLENGTRVRLSHSDPAAVIRFTLDGGTPGRSSATYKSPIEMTEPTTIRARAYKSGWNRSIAVHATFVPD
jgi:uncharacterized repeat protein (TIGR03806 family)